eukprot:3727137-Rhodomonas_salina.3
MTSLTIRRMSNVYRDVPKYAPPLLVVLCTPRAGGLLRSDAAGRNILPGNLSGLDFGKLLRRTTILPESSIGVI